MRTKAFRFLSIATLALVLSACHVQTKPVSSAIVNEHQNGQTVKRWPLPEKQREALSAWLSSNSWGWQPIAATRLPNITVQLQFADGTATRASLFPNLIEFGNHEKPLSAKDSKVLHEIIMNQNGN